MDPADFLLVAEPFQASDSEAERRTCIGRSYYGLYNLLVGFLTSRGVSLGKGPFVHQRLVQRLEQSGHFQAQKLAERLKKLRSLRNDADYNMSLVIDASQSQMAYRWARSAVDLFHRLPEAEQDNMASTTSKTKAPAAV